jgi:hypothetical protein
MKPSNARGGLRPFIVARGQSLSYLQASKKIQFQLQAWVIRSRVEWKTLVIEDFTIKGRDKV